MSDLISIRGIEVWTCIGILEEERQKEQCILVTIDLLHPTRTVGVSDDIQEGIDYARVVDEVVKLGRIERKTIERLAEDIASLVLKDFTPQNGVRVTVEKRPPINAAAASVTIVRPCPHPK